MERERLTVEAWEQQKLLEAQQLAAKKQQEAAALLAVKRQQEEAAAKIRQEQDQIWRQISQQGQVIHYYQRGHQRNQVKNRNIMSLLLSMK